MPQLVWTEEMSVGDPLLDAQHRQLVDLLNTFNDLMTPADIRCAITCMSRYADTHFRDEELLLERVGCPLLDKQRHEHQTFMLKAAELSGQDSAEISVQIKLATFLTRWLMHHILTEDMKYKPYVQNRTQRPQP